VSSFGPFEASYIPPPPFPVDGGLLKASSSLRCRTALVPFPPPCLFPLTSFLTAPPPLPVTLAKKARREWCCVNGSRGLTSNWCPSLHLLFSSSPSARSPEHRGGRLRSCAELPPTLPPPEPFYVGSDSKFLTVDGKLSGSSWCQLLPLPSRTTPPSRLSFFEQIPVDRGLILKAQYLSLPLHSPTFAGSRNICCPLLPASFFSFLFYAGRLYFGVFLILHVCMSEKVELSARPISPPPLPSSPNARPGECNLSPLSALSLVITRPYS